MLELEQDSKRQILTLEISQLIDGGQTSHDFNTIQYNFSQTVSLSFRTWT